jgi:uncharacterized BrkB/YihY/UPF0761 family membrane protein
MDSVRAFVERRSESLVEMLEQRRAEGGWIDLGARLYERDREADGSVLASAVALRMFLFFVPLVLVLVGTLGFVGDHLSSDDASRQVGVTGGFATQIDAALNQSSRARWLALGSGLVGTALAARTLSLVLAASSRRAWGLPARVAPSSITRVAGAITGLVVSVALLAILVNRAQKAAGVVGGSLAIGTAMLAYAAAWFVVCVMLPRADSADRTALLPGALVVGAGLALAQAALQFVITGQVSRASELYGAIGSAIVALGWFFLVGRLIVVSLTVDAVVWERYGSLATLLMRLGPLRRFAEGHPRFARFLELDTDATPGGEPEQASPETPPEEERRDASPP